MIIFSFILLIFVVIYLLYKYALELNIIIDTVNENMNLTVLWLYPFLKVKLFIINNKPVMEIYIFTIRIIKKFLKKNKRQAKRLKIIKNIDLKNTDLITYYGFKDKYLSGVACGFLNFISQFITIEHFEQIPDFTTDKDYIYIRFKSYVNIIPSFKKSVTDL